VKKSINDNNIDNELEELDNDLSNYDHIPLDDASIIANIKTINSLIGNDSSYLSNSNIDISDILTKIDNTVSRILSNNTNSSHLLKYGTINSVYNYAKYIYYVYELGLWLKLYYNSSRRLRRLYDNLNISSLHEYLDYAHLLNLQINNYDYFSYRINCDNLKQVCFLQYNKSQFDIVKSIIDILQIIMIQFYQWLISIQIM